MLSINVESAFDKEINAYAADEPLARRCRFVKNQIANESRGERHHETADEPTQRFARRRRFVARFDAVERVQLSQNAQPTRSKVRPSKFRSKAGFEIRGWHSLN